MNAPRAFLMVTLVLLGGAGRPAPGQALIPRRHEALGMFLTRPEAVYRHYCAPCHGRDAHGRGNHWTTELPGTPADLTALARGEAFLEAVIRGGSAAHGKSSLCPPYGRIIAPENIKRLARYLVSLRGRPPAPPGQAEAWTRPAAPGGEPFPWLLAVVILGELAVVGRLLKHGKA